jgi:zinc transport system substrate-binding protein
MNGLYPFFLSLIFFWNVAAQPNYTATIHPLQQIVHELIGPGAVIHDLLPPGASPHTYEPTPADVRQIESSAILFTVGPNLDDWVKKFPARRILEMINLIPKDSLIFFEKFLTGENAPLGEEKSTWSYTHHQGVDPHFWTDPLLVKSLLVNLADSLVKLIPGQYQSIQENCIRFSIQLTNLDSEIRERLKPYQGKTVVQAHPFFNYYLHRYGLKSGGIVEINPGVDPTARQIKNMIDRIRSENIVAIFTQPQLPDRAARLLAETTGIKIVELDPLGGKPNRQTYEEILLYNTQLVIGALQ